MKISTAIALGRHLIKPLAGIHLTVNGRSGCAWGMVNKAVPEEFVLMSNRAKYTRATLPCECRNGNEAIGSCMRVQPIYDFNNLSNIIVHLFNDHVMTKKDWTMDQLIDWVAANEPADPEEQVTERATAEEKTPVHA